MSDDNLRIYFVWPNLATRTVLYIVTIISVSRPCFSWIINLIIGLLRFQSNDIHGYIDYYEGEFNNNVVYYNGFSSA